MHYDVAGTEFEAAAEIGDCAVGAAVANICEVAVGFHPSPEVWAAARFDSPNCRIWVQACYPLIMNAERDRVGQAERQEEHWRRWGTYVSDRAWGTVREDYSPNGTAWDYFPFEQAHLRAFRWSEDALFGWCDNHQRICFGLALWNGKDSILKERLYGLSGPLGNHSEDVKELYYYLDATPTHSYCKALYKYPQAAFPYARLAEESRRRSRLDPEFELMDTGVFDDDRYFDVTVEYAKADVNDTRIRITAVNRGPVCETQSG